MNKNKQFAKMSNEELCAIAAKLKFQLVEARFKMSSGEIEKISVVKEIRRTIAKIFTELTNRGYKVTIGSHGIAMYDIKNGNAPIALDTKKINELMTKEDKKEEKKAEKPAEEKKPAAKKARKSTIKEKVVEDKKEDKGDKK